MRKIRQRLGAFLKHISPFGTRTFGRVRFDFECALQRAVDFLSPAYRARIRGLRGTKHLSINVGSGGFGRPDWVNIDAHSRHKDSTFAHDIRLPVPLAPGSAKRIFAEHIIEHLDFRHEIPRVLADFHRLLEPGGTLRIVVPDTARYLEAYVSGDWAKWEALGWHRDRWPDDIVSPMHAVNHVFHQEGEHYFGYDWQTLEKVLRAAGFTDVKRMSYGASVDPELAIDRDEHSLYSLYVDAVK